MFSRRGADHGTVRRCLDLVSELDRRILRDQADLAVISDLDADVDIAAG